MNNYDFSVLKKIGIDNVEKVKNTIVSNPIVVFKGEPGLGKSRLATLVSELLADWHIVRLNKSKVDEIRSVISSMKEFYLEGKEKLIIIDEADKCTTDALDEFRCHTDGTDNLQLHVLLLCNEKIKIKAIASRAITLDFTYPDKSSLINYWKEHLPEYNLDQDQKTILNNLMQIIPKEFNHRDFEEVIRLLKLEYNNSEEILMMVLSDYDGSESTEEIKELWTRIDKSLPNFREALVLLNRTSLEDLTRCFKFATMYIHPKWNSVYVYILSKLHPMERDIFTYNKAHFILDFLAKNKII